MGKVTLKYTAKMHPDYFESKIGSLAIEVFNTMTSEWFIFLGDLVITEKGISKQKTISDKDAEDDNLKFLISQIEKKIYPKSRIRLIEGNTIESRKSKIAKIVSDNYKVTQTESVTTYDFGNNWLLKNEDFIESKETILIASQHNIFPLYDKIKKAEDASSELLKEKNEFETKFNNADTLLKKANENLDQKDNLLIKAESDLQTSIKNEESLQETNTNNETKAKEDQDTINALKTDKSNLNTTILEKDSLYSELQSKYNDLKNTAESTHPNKLPASSVYQNFVRDVSSADLALQDSNYKLSNISLDIKATVENGGDGVVLGLVDFDSLSSINGEGISSIKLNIERDTTVQEVSFKVPKVTEMTPSKVKSILLGAGYRLGSIQQNPNSTAANGLSIKQFPAAGSELAQGETVTVLFN